MTDRNKTVLCVDDDPFYTQLYEQILTPKGYRVTVAQNPQEGYDAVEKDRPDVMILDVMMPERGEFRDGFGLLEKLRGEAKNKSLPIVMISALGNAEDVEHGMRLGADAYVPKQDMMPERLIEEIEKALSK